MDNFYRFCIKLVELFKKDTHVKIATAMLFGGITLLSGISITIQNESFNLSFNEPNMLMMILGTILIITGLIMGIIKFKNANKDYMSTLYIGAGIRGTTQLEPIKYLPSFERAFTISRPLEKINTYDKNEVLEDYKFNKKLFRNHIDHLNAKNVYMASLGSFPYQFLLGSLLRNGYRKVVIMDFDRAIDEWYMLSTIGTKKHNIIDTSKHKKNETIDNAILSLQNNPAQEVGIALSYTFEIKKNSIPNYLQNNTLYLQHSGGRDHDLLSDKVSQSSLLKELSQYIEKLSRKKTVCLFVSAQSSFCLNLGKNYMDNSHGKLKIYNYDRNSGLQNWFIEFNNGEIS